MHTHIVHAHPEPESYNSALTKHAQNAMKESGDTVTVSDLYCSGFDPVERGGHYLNRSEQDRFAALAEQRHAWNTDTLPDDVMTEIKHLERADLVILQFPLWWHAPPAILKGWMDRVFVSGGLYRSKMRYNTGYFRGRRALVSVTTGAPKEAFGPNSRGGDFQTMLWPVQYSMHYMGFSVMPPFISYGVQGHGYSYDDQSAVEERLRARLIDWQSYLLKLEETEPLCFPTWSDWNEDGSAKKINEGNLS